MDGCVDREALLDRIDGDLEFLAEAVALLESHGRRLVEELQTASAAGDRNMLINKAHTLKGMVSNFCAEAVLRAAEEIEDRARKGALDGISRRIGVFATSFDRMCRETRAIAFPGEP